MTKTSSSAVSPTTSISGSGILTLVEGTQFTLSLNCALAQGDPDIARTPGFDAPTIAWT